MGVARDVAALMKQRVPLRQARERIDAKWGPVGPPTRTPYPPA